MTPEQIATNLGILVFGCTAVWLIGRPESWRRWGYFLGLCSQPFWFYMAYKHKDWGVFFLNCLYAYSWAQGVWFHWFKLEQVQPEDITLVPETRTQVSEPVLAPSTPEHNPLATA
ncbi:MAG: hypothetical protein QOJ88_1399 [Pyrinomonadaceae bacterium]|jgi:nicotinamide riboside transporter PnuC|nr:hypothetical protein [Pyrinomonadaceae bacterium]